MKYPRPFVFYFDMLNIFQVPRKVYDHGWKYIILRLKVNHILNYAILRFQNYTIIKLKPSVWRYTTKEPHLLVFIRQKLYDLRLKVYDHDWKFTTLAESIRSWLKIYHHSREVYGDLFKIYDLWIESIRSSEILIFHIKNTESIGSLSA